MTSLEKILNLIKIRGLSDIEFTRLVGISKATVSEWKNGRIKSYNKHLPKIAEVLEVDVKDLMDDPEEESLFSPVALAENIEKLSKTRGLNINELLKELNLKADTIKNFKNGMSPTIDVLNVFSKKFKVPFEVLYGIKEEIDYEPINYLYIKEPKALYKPQETNLSELHIKLLTYFDRLTEEDKDFILGEMVRLYKKSQE